MHEGASRFQDPELLICPVCREKVYPQPPAYWQMRYGPRPNFSHSNRLALCVITLPDGRARPAEPVMARW